MNQRQKEILQAQLDREKAVLKKLEENYEDALAEINSKIELLMARQDADMQHVIYQVEYQKALKTQVQSILETLQANEFETVSEYLTQSYEDGFIGTMYDLQGQGIPLVFPIDQQQVVEAIMQDTKLSENLYTTMGHDMADLKKKITGEISRGLSSGQMYSEIARNVSDWARIPQNNAMRIARTEAHRIQCKAALDAQNKAKEKGADVVKQWDSSLDGRTRKSHRKLDGQIRELDEPFEVNGHKAMFPGDFGRPEEDINCRCAILQRARWALGNDYTKWPEDAPVEIADDGTTQFVMIEADNYKDFQKKYNQASERVRENVQKINDEEVTTKELTVEDVNASGSKMLADTYEQHRIKNKMTSVSYAELGDTATDIVNVNYGKMSVESASAFNNTIEGLVSEYDTPLQRIRTMTKDEFMTHGDSFAYVSHNYTVDSAELVINPTKCKDINKMIDRIKELSENGYCVKIPDELADKYVATHEFAHTLLNMEQKLSNKTNWLNADYDKIKKARKEIASIYDDYMKEVQQLTVKRDSFNDILFDFNSTTEQMEEAGKQWEKYDDLLNEIKLSEYSLMNADEFMAEAFT